MRKRYNKEDFEIYLKDSKSVRDLIIKVGITPHGGAVAYYKNKLKEWNLDTSHFLGQRWALGISSTNKKKSEERLVKGKFVRGSILKRVLLELNVKEECSICKIDKWQNKKINLEIDHIDGDNTNNLKENLRFICPNCHSQTETYKFYGKKHKM